jgi:hypothetical protein
MKVTKSYLKQVIKEELSRMKEESAPLSSDALFWSKSYKKAAERIGSGKASADMVAGFKHAYEKWQEAMGEPAPYQDADAFVDNIYTGGWSDKAARQRVLDVIKK